jgi:hypothetical protein
MMGMHIKTWCNSIHKWAHEKGFYEEPHSVPCKHRSGGIPGSLMLIVSELSEALEADRNENRELFCEEIADTAIRLFDLCSAEGIDLEERIKKKMAKNWQRPFRHGKAY